MKKNSENILKHGLSFEDAQYAFLDQNRIILKDEKHSQREERFFCIGRVNEKIATVRFTPRKNAIRIFGAGFWREGKKIYERKK